MPVAFRAELCVERRREAVVEECVKQIYVVHDVFLGSR